MKRKLFIGSSGGRGVTVAEAVASQIKKACGDWLECEIWDRGDAFAINESFLANLLRAAQRHHYGVFVATKDDRTVKKGASIIEPRDNVIFEMGLFLGSMGSTRSFLLVEKGVGLPSDFEGITMSQFSHKDRQSTRKAVDRLVQEICYTRKSFNLKPIPSAALALGYFDNFLKPFAEKYWEKCKERATVKVVLPKRLISYEAKSDFNDLIDLYASFYPSDDVSIYQPDTRPVIKRIRRVDGTESGEKQGQPLFWDIPTTIFTLKQLFAKLPSMSEAIGVDQRQEDWILSEMHEFGRSLAVLTSDTLGFKRGVSLEIVLLDIKNGKPAETALGTH